MFIYQREKVIMDNGTIITTQETYLTNSTISASKSLEEWIPSIGKKFAIAFLVVYILGTIGNIINLATCFKQEMKTVVHLFLRIIYVLNIICASGTFFLSMKEWETSPLNFNYTLSWIFTYLGVYFNEVVQIINIFVHVILVNERYFCICKPHKMKTFDKFRLSAYLLIIIAFLSVLINIPSILLHVIQTNEDEKTYLIVPNVYYFYNDYVTFFICIRVIFCRYMPTVYVMFCTAWIITTYKLWMKKEKREKQICNDAAACQELTDDFYLWFISVILFYVSNITWTATTFLYLLHSPADLRNFSRPVVISFFVTLLSYSVLFYIYIFLPTFRKKFITLFKSPCKK